MDFIRLIYASRATRSITYRDLIDIQRGASAANRTQGLTGLLVYGEGYFLQTLEGASSAVNQCYHRRVLTDPRHTDFHLLAVERGGHRLFADWGMGLTRVNAEIMTLLESGTEAKGFDPLKMTGEVALAFLRLLSDVKQGRGFITGPPATVAS